ncbi:MAG TPA: peptidylprolyl isomerase [Gemmatimonadales bacterium]|nr:peptidylprolyl isomerase [Gemmatimonadales bacterium]
MRRLLGPFYLLASLAVTPPLESQVEQLGRLLAMEDSRVLDSSEVRLALTSPDPLVRRTGATAVGRIRDRAGIPWLAPLLADPDSSVRLAAAFALGLLGDSSAVPQLILMIEFFGAGPAGEEAVTAISKIGGGRALGFITELLAGKALPDLPGRGSLRARAAVECFRFGRSAPVPELIALTISSDDESRFGAVYALARTHGVGAQKALLAALADPLALIRMYAARALVRSYADSGGLDPKVVAPSLLGLLRDSSVGVQINAVRSISSYSQIVPSHEIYPFLGSSNGNLAVQATTTVAALGGPSSGQALYQLATTSPRYAQRREAFLGLATVDSTRFRRIASEWSRAPDWRLRAAAAEGWGLLGTGDRYRGSSLLDDRDGRVLAAALVAQSGGDGVSDATLRAGRRLLGHPDAVVRSVAADVLSRVSDPADLPALIRAYRRALRDSIPDAATSALGAIKAISDVSESLRARVESDFVRATPRPAEFLIRRWSAEQWPTLGEQWRPVLPVESHHPAAWYQEIARRFLLADSTRRYPRVRIQTGSGAPIVLELFGPDAPLTVDNFLHLAQGRFFDRHRWHRVVPNFVVQDGDPRGDGSGGPGGAIRDEINPRRYDAYVVGMALSGPDTGSSQWFITLSPQPHLNGTYTVFGRVVAGVPNLLSLTQGDPIESIRGQQPR